MCPRSQRFWRNKSLFLTGEVENQLYTKGIKQLTFFCHHILETCKHDVEKHQNSPANVQSYRLLELLPTLARTEADPRKAKSLVALS